MIFGGDGWALAAMNDRTGRRGIWYREVRDGEELRALEVCGGREGDDWGSRFVVGEVLTGPVVAGLRDVLQTGAWMVEESFAGMRRRDADRVLDALVRKCQHMPAGEVFARRPDGTPVTAEELIRLLEIGDDVAQQFVEDVVGAAVTMVGVQSRSK